MKKFNVILIVLLLANVSMVLAQKGNRGQGGQGGQRGGGEFSSEDMGKRQIERMKAALSLSDDQVSSIQLINDNFAKEMKQMRSKYPNRKERRVAIAELKKKKEADTRAVLRPDQLVKYDEFKKQQQNRSTGTQGGNGGRGGKGKGNGGGGGNNF